MALYAESHSSTLEIIHAISFYTKLDKVKVISVASGDSFTCSVVISGVQISADKS